MLLHLLYISFSLYLWMDVLALRCANMCVNYSLLFSLLYH